MARKKPVIELDPPEITEAEFAKFRPAREVLSPEFYALVTSRGRPKASDPKVPVTIRLDRAVVEALKATGAGWQTRLNAKLRQDLLGS